MTRRLFFTGPIGCGKSTVIARALGDRLPACGGFLTRRYREPELCFALESPDGSRKAVFLEVANQRLDLTVFEQLGTRLLAGEVLILDEIGGIEVLCPEFMEALEALLQSDIPIIGVIKGEGPANALIRTMGLTREYEESARLLRRRLESDAHTTVYTCGQFDETALHMAESWVKEYVK